MSGRIWQFSLPYPKPPRGLSANDRTHWSVKSRSTRAVREDVVCLAQFCGIPTLERVRVDVEWVVSTGHRRDTDNLAPLLKAIYDGLGADKGISAHIVPDDAPEFMVKPGATIQHVKGGSPRFVVTVTDLGGAS